MRITDFAKMMVSRSLKPGDLAIDATAGNGYDTEYLARTVGSDGFVIAIDVQEAAIRSARQRLKALGMASRVRFVKDSHERIHEHVVTEKVLPGAIMFNLGYLPGAVERSVQTGPETTLRALEASVDLLRPGGILSVVYYPGHPGGARESEVVRAFGGNLDAKRFSVCAYERLNARDTAPGALIVECRDRTESANT